MHSYPWAYGAIYYVFNYTICPRKGLGRSLTDHLPKTASWIITVFVLLLPLYWGLQGLIAINSFLISLVYLRHVFIKRIGGITGDTVGAAIEIGETVLIFTFVVSYFYLV